MPRRKKQTKGAPKELVRVATAPAAVEKTPRPVRETVVIHTTRERKRNAGLAANPLINGAVMAGGSVAGGAASVIVTENTGLDPMLAGVATGSAALGLAQLVKKVPLAKNALTAASMGAAGLVGIHLIARHYAKKSATKPQHATSTQHTSSADLHAARARMADGGAPVTRAELNDALSAMADRQNQTCDLITALHSEIKSVVAETQTQKGTATPSATTTTHDPSAPTSNLIRLRYVREADPETYERNAYGGMDERDADAIDTYERNAYGGMDERDADVIDTYERNAYGEERDASIDERDAYVEERDAVPDERDAYVEERDAAPDERDAFVEERDAVAEE